MAWSEADSAAMEAAAESAKAELALDLGRMTAEQLVGALVILKWFKKWFMTAGHKRLGRLAVDFAKKVESDFLIRRQA